MDLNENYHYLEFKLEGSKADGGKVRINEFQDFLAHVNICLKKIETSISGKPSAFYRITNLKAKCAIIGIEAVPYKAEKDDTVSIYDRFVESITSIQEKNVLPEWIDNELLEDLKRLTIPLSRNITSIEIRRNGEQFEITKQLEVNIEKVLKEHILASKGTITGYLDALNVHKDGKFHIYPPIGPTRIYCCFEKELLPKLLPKIKKGVKRYVSVIGIMHYRENEAFPTKIDVEDIEIYPPENELPALSSLRGMAPEVTGDLNPVDFVRKLRKEFDG